MRSSTSGFKRARTDNPPNPVPALTPEFSDPDASFQSSKTTPNNNLNGSSTFRNVSACNRCRLRKNRCDQNLPACSLCAKAGVRCVGFDPITKREIPRTYVYYLESRLNYLETLLADHGIPFAPSREFDLGAIPSTDQHQVQMSSSPALTHATKVPTPITTSSEAYQQPGAASGREKDEHSDLNELVSNISMASVQGVPDPRYLGTGSGMSFARLVFSAVKDSVSNGSSGKAFRKAIKPAATATGTSMRDSFFGLHSKSSIQPAPFPDRDLGLRLVALYFSFSNPQIPILHKGEFMDLFERTYATQAACRSARELYMLNIVFAIGAGIILENSHWGLSSGSASTTPTRGEPASPEADNLSPPSQQYQPEEYHASAMMHLETFLSPRSAVNNLDGFGGGLEELQAVLLLAGFALLRPVAPGLWYITGVATRLGVDLGLHHEDGTDLDESLAFDQQKQNAGPPSTYPSEPHDGTFRNIDANERGRREWMRDLRRRLWWCVYSFDRLVSTCVGRPFGITDSVITTDFPALLNDEDITRSGFVVPCESFNGPSYKRVSHHYFRLRLLQSEILSVLQYKQAKQTRASSGKEFSRYMHTRLSSSFLQPFDSFRAWRQDIDRRLWEWKESAPLQEETGVQFDVRFLELNYWQVVIMLYRQSLGVMPKHAGPEMSWEDIDPMSVVLNDDVEDEDIHLKIAEAGQRVLILYRQLHRIHLVNYTYLATVHLFMAGIAFLYVLWHSSTVRSRLTLDDVDFTVLAATSVLGDLSDKCPPAEACRDAFERMSRATVKMCLSTTGFGAKVAENKVPDGQVRHENDAAAERSLPHIQHPEVHRPPFQYDSRQEDRVGEDRPGWKGTKEGYEASFDLDPHHPFPETEFDLLRASDDLMGFDADLLGTNLGFEHDWSDGLQLDLFDGFFFGGGNMASSVS